MYLAKKKVKANCGNAESMMKGSRLRIKEWHIKRKVKRMG